MSKPKIGAGHAGAMWRLGLAELRQAFSYGSGSVEQPTPYGIYGTKTPGEVMQDKNNDQAVVMNQEPGKMSLEALKEHAAEKAQEAGHQMGMGHERQHEHERGGHER